MKNNTAKMVKSFKRIVSRINVSSIEVHIMIYYIYTSHWIMATELPDWFFHK